MSTLMEDASRNARRHSPRRNSWNALWFARPVTASDAGQTIQRLVRLFELGAPTLELGRQSVHLFLQRPVAQPQPRDTGDGDRERGERQQGIGHRRRILAYRPSLAELPGAG
tara:strand:- start:245 stop:580 length:336 start_codon:yes stop_codon:yes gene_type:complete